MPPEKVDQGPADEEHEKNKFHLEYSWQKQVFHLFPSIDSSLWDLKSLIYSQTLVLPKRQKILGKGFK